MEDGGMEEGGMEVAIFTFHFSPFTFLDALKYL
jgi:hypothetical protein